MNCTLQILAEVLYEWNGNETSAYSRGYVCIKASVFLVSPWQMQTNQKTEQAYAFSVLTILHMHLSDAIVATIEMLPVQRTAR